MNELKQAHGTYWTVKEGQPTAGVYLGHGCRVPETIGGIDYNIPLKTYEWTEENRGGEATQAVRYFSSASAMGK